MFLVGFTWEVPGSELVLGCRKGFPCGLERQWRAPIRDGRPLNIVMANDLGGFLFNGQKRPNRGQASTR